MYTFMNHLSQKKLHGPVYQWVEAKEAQGIADDKLVPLANAVIDYLRFVKLSKPHSQRTRPKSSL